MKLLINKKIISVKELKTSTWLVVANPATASVSRVECLNHDEKVP